MIEIKVPAIGESISEVTLLKWTKKDGDYVERDEVIAEFESEKATFEVNAEQAGVLTTLGKEGDTLLIGDVLAKIDETAERPAAAAVPAAPAAPAPVAPKSEAPVAAIPNDVKATPVASAIIADKKVDPTAITATGTGGKILKQDVLEALSHPGKKAFAGTELNTRNVRQEKMSALRKTISRRLVESKNTTAMLTTFNEVDMTRVMEVRKQYKDKFKESHGVNLGFMSFFAKACSTALGEWPSVNAYIDGDQIIYHDYADISIAVSTPRGLTVPVMRNVESMSMADVEKTVVILAGKARDSKLTADDLQGGTFTITNGGVFVSLMSTPILNPPQVAILGVGGIQRRLELGPSGELVEVEWMGLSLTFDHRAVNGSPAAEFLDDLCRRIEEYAA